ncbi:MAG: VC0807 family protein, partial [Verrucomicrobiota bacterium]
RRRQANFVSILGFVSVLLTGGLTLVASNLMWFAIKEAAVPAVIGLTVLLSMNSRRPLIRQFVYNDQVIDTAKVDAALAQNGNVQGFKALMVKASWLVAATFMLSSALNFVFARWMLKSPVKSEAFNQELARMNLISLGVIALPTLAMLMFVLWQLFGGIKRLTGLEREEILHAPPEKK